MLQADTDKRIGLGLLTVFALLLAAIPGAQAATNLTSCTRSYPEGDMPQWSCIGVHGGCVQSWVEVDGNREFNPNRAPDDPEMNDAGREVCAHRGADASASYSCGLSCAIHLDLPGWVCSETKNTKLCGGYEGRCAFVWNDRNDNDEHERGETLHETCAGTVAVLLGGA